MNDLNAAEKVYEGLGNYVADRAGDEWALAWLVAEIEFEDAGTTYGRYKTTMGATDEVHQFDTDHEAYHLFAELREATRHPEHGPFTQAVFTVSRDGAFTIDFEYESLEGFSWQRSKVLSREKGQQTSIPPAG